MRQNETRLMTKTLDRFWQKAEFYLNLQINSTSNIHLKQYIKLDMRQENIDTRQLLPVGTLLQGGKYRVERYLSSGNFGNTYIVENTGMQVQFAMKEFYLRNICYRTGGSHAVSVSPAVDPTRVDIQREKFKKEARRLYGLTSKHLVHVNDMFEENGTIYYVMDFVKGESLANYMERNNQPLTEEQTLYILQQLMDGLDEIHSKQIWHLDLKPDNMMIDKNGNVVIIDFGASKQVGQSGGYTGTSSILCYTPGYAPLEQVNQNMEAIGPWTDIYALGATLYNLLTRIDPTTVNPSMLQFPQNVSKKTQQIVRHMMKTDMKERPQSIDELRQLVDAPADTKDNGHGISLSLSSVPRKKWIAVPAGIVAVAIILGFILLGGSKSHEEVNEQTGVQQVQVSQVKKADVDQPAVDVDSMPVSEAKTVLNQYFDSALGVCSYSGPVDADGKPDGIGEVSFTDGRLYKGPFVHGNMEGENAYFRYDNGDSFEGSFVNNSFSKGRYTIKENGDYFIGSFRNGQPDDKNGQWYDKNGNKY